MWNTDMTENTSSVKYRILIEETEDLAEDDAVQYGKHLPIFQSFLLHPSSG
jgi:hypothetical protein